GAGSGIGWQAGLQLAEAGCRILAVDINPEGAATVCDEIHRSGGSAVPVIGDLSEQHVVDTVVTTARDTYGGVDVLVNDAGVMDRMSAPADTTDAEWERLMRINLTAPFLLTRAVLPLMLENERSAIVNSAS